jgi:hypothetical protein
MSTHSGHDIVLVFRRSLLQTLALRLDILHTISYAFPSSIDPASIKVTWPPYTLFSISLFIDTVAYLLKTIIMKAVEAVVNSTLAL